MIQASVTLTRDDLARLTVVEEKAEITMAQWMLPKMVIYRRVADRGCISLFMLLSQNT